MAQYPPHLERQRVLFDGTPVTIRPIRAEDSGMEQEFVRHLSDDSRYFRFMGSVRELPSKKLEFFTKIDYDRHMAFVATIVRENQELEIGVARYVATEESGHCEFAIAVDDGWQGTGVAGLLMISLVQAGRGRHQKSPKSPRQRGSRFYHQPGEADTVHIELRL